MAARESSQVDEVALICKAGFPRAHAEDAADVVGLSSLCPFSQTHERCKPCRWHAEGKCRNGARCKFCHVHSIQPKAIEAAHRAETDRQGLRAMLEGTKELQALEAYEQRVEALLSTCPAARALKGELTQAHISSMSETRELGPKLLGPTGRQRLAQNNRIAQAKLLVEKVERFKERQGDCERWRQPAAERLHESIWQRLEKAESLDACQGWLAVADEMTRLMIIVTAPTRGCCGEADDAELRELLCELAAIFDASANHADCRRSLKDEYGA